MIQTYDKPVIGKKTVKLARKSNHLPTTLLNQIITPIRVSSHTSQFGSCEEQINDTTGLFYAEHNKRHLSITKLFFYRS